MSIKHNKMKLHQLRLNEHTDRKCKHVIDKIMKTFVFLDPKQRHIYKHY